MAYESLVVDDALALELMMDMLLYEQVPELVPLRGIVLQKQSSMRRHCEEGPVESDIIRKWYKELAGYFFRFVGMLVKAGHTEKLKVIKRLLQERHKLDVGTLVVPCPGVGLVEL